MPRALHLLTLGLGFSGFISVLIAQYDNIKSRMLSAKLMWVLLSK